MDAKVSTFSFRGQWPQAGHAEWAGGAIGSMIPCGSLPVCQAQPHINGKLDVTNGLVNGKVNGLEHGKMNGLANGKINGLVNGKVNGLEHGKMNGLTNGKINGMVNGKVNGKVNGVHHNGASAKVGGSQSMTCFRFRPPDMETLEGQNYCFGFSCRAQWASNSTCGNIVREQIYSSIWF